MAFGFPYQFAGENSPIFTYVKSFWPAPSPGYPMRMIPWVAGSGSGLAPSLWIICNRRMKKKPPAEAGGESLGVGLLRLENAGKLAFPWG